jgi:hypothetical protein
VLFGDQFQAYVMRFSTLGGLWFDPLQRIYLVYVGSTIVLLGLIVLWLFCPRVIQRYPDRRQYVQHMRDDATTDEMREINEKLAGFRQHVIDLLDADPREEAPVLGMVSRRLFLQAMRLINDDMNRAEVQESGGAYAAYAVYYEWLDRRRPVLSTLCLALLVVGAGLFILPSLEVLLMAFRRMVFGG